MYTFLRMGVNDFKNRMKMFEKYLYFQKDETSPLRFTSVEVTYSLVSYKQSSHLDQRGEV